MQNVILEVVVERWHEQPRDCINLEFKLYGRDTANSWAVNDNFVNEEGRDICSGIIAGNGDSSRERNVDKVNLDCEFSRAVEPRPELKVSSAKNGNILVSWRRGKIVKLSAVKMHVNDRISAILGREAREGNIKFACG